MESFDFEQAALMDWANYLQRLLGNLHLQLQHPENLRPFSRHHLPDKATLDALNHLRHGYRSHIESIEERLQETQDAYSRLESDANTVCTRNVFESVWRLARSVESLLEMMIGKGGGGHHVESWSRPMSKKEAAKLLGCPAAKKSEWINNCVKDGTLRIRKCTRQTFQFELSTIAENVRDKFI